MNPDLPESAIAFGRSAERAFAAAGGTDLARRCEIDGGLRSAEVAPILDAIGADGIDPRSDAETAAAAAELCRVAGRVVLPYPVASVLLRDRSDGLPYTVVPDRVARVDHGDLFAEWRVTTLAEATRLAHSGRPRLQTRLGPFVTDLTPGEPGPDSSADDARTALWSLTLTAWQITGALERAVELAVDHARGRIQFGKPIAAFQAVQFQLADAAVAVDGLRALAAFTLWRMDVAPDRALPDVLGLRLHALDVARSVLRATQQIHGAAGVCDEYDISVICRHVQPLLRLPAGAEACAAALATAIGRTGFDGLFPHGADLAGAVP